MVAFNNKWFFQPVQFWLLKGMVSSAKAHNQQFQEYLRKEKEIVSFNLKKKVFPSTKYEDYNFLKILGHGSYGMVVAAENIQSKKLFAVKIIKKKILVKAERLRHLMSEIRILNSVNFSFLISLECYFTNNCAVFIVLPYIKGGHFFNLLRMVKKFNEDVARFFAGQVVLAIEYLHYMGIIYRDLKPENLLLDLEGYLKIVDYGFAKYIGHNYSYSFCGTPEYLAPEILMNTGHSVSPDWWCLGILLYEMCNGSPPFTSANELKLFEKIIKGKIQWPGHFSNGLKSIVEGLLQVDKTKRLGCTKRKVEDIKYHEWFSSLNWSALWNKKISPPITPNNAKWPEEPQVWKVKSVQNCTHAIPSSMIRNIDFSV